MHDRNRSVDVQHLQGCLNDLVSLLALPALWNGREPPAVLGILLDVLLRMLPLEFAYARLNSSDTAACEICRTAERGRVVAPQELGRMLDPWVKLGPPGLATEMPRPLGSGSVSMVHAWLGLDRERGWWL